MFADTGNHAQSFLQLHTGEKLRPSPSMGSWVAYGLGTENQNLPGFISLNTAKPSVYSSAFLPPIYEGTPIGINGEDMSKATISNISGEHLPLAVKRQQLDLIQSLNRNHLAARRDDQRLEGVIQTMELGYRMQAAAPELVDLSHETAESRRLYGLDEKDTHEFGTRCLLGFHPTTPHNAAGIRVEPPVSQPIAISHIPSATATPPPAERIASWIASRVCPATLPVTTTTSPTSGPCTFPR